MMFHMKTASVRDLRQDFPRILAWIEAGEEVAITMRRQAVARLVPLPRKKQAKRRIPDIADRLKRVFGAKIIPDKTIKTIMEQNKGAIFSEFSPLTEQIVIDTGELHGGLRGGGLSGQIAVQTLNGQIKIK